MCNVGLLYFMHEIGKLEERENRGMRKASRRTFDDVTGVELAELYGVSKQMISELHSVHGAPRNQNKTYRLKEFIAWHEAWATKQLEDGDPASSPALERQRTAKAAMLEIQLEEMKGQYIKRAVMD